MILKKIAVCTTIAGLCTALIGAAVIPASSVEANSTNVIRLAGDTRYDTMSRIIQAEVPGTSEYVVVASGDNFPDALAAAPLAGALKAPIVLTSGNVLSPQAEQQITRLKASKAVIIGGVNAISRATVSRIHGLVGSVPSVFRGKPDTKHPCKSIFKAKLGWGFSGRPLNLSSRQGRILLMRYP